MQFTLASWVPHYYGFFFSEVTISGHFEMVLGVQRLQLWAPEASFYATKSGGGYKNIIAFFNIYASVILFLFFSQVKASALVKNGL